MAHHFTAIILSKADSPLKRLGIVSIALAVLIWIGTAVYFNFTWGSFIALERSSWIEKVPQPATAPEGSYWRDDLGGWGLYDRACVAQKRTGNFDLTLPSECRTNFFPHRRQYRESLETSLPDYFAEMFEAKSGFHSWNVAAIVAIFVGFLLYSGIGDSLLRWIRHGNK